MAIYLSLYSEGNKGDNGLYQFFAWKPFAHGWQWLYNVQLPASE